MDGWSEVCTVRASGGKLLEVRVSTEELQYRGPGADTWITASDREQMFELALAVTLKIYAEDES